MACFLVAERLSSAPLVPLGVLTKPAVFVPNAANFYSRWSASPGCMYSHSTSRGAGPQRAYRWASVHPHDPRLRSRRFRGRATRYEARGEDDGIFGPRAGDRGVALDDADVRRRGPYL